MAIKSKFLVAAAVATLTISYATAEDASPTPNALQASQSATSAVVQQSDPIARAAAVYGLSLIHI